MSINETVVVDLLYPYVRSILGGKNKEIPEFVGSGFLLRDHENLYLVTAAHVMDFFVAENYPLFLDADSGLVGISGEAVCSYTEDPINRKDDRTDISIVKLSCDTQKRLELTKFIEMKHLDLIGEHDSQLGYFSVGITAKRGNKGINRNEKLISTEPYGLLANESSLETYRKLKVTKSSHLALSYNLKEVYSQDKVKRTAPALKGLSGAPIWGFKRKSDTEIGAVVVAILIEYHQKDIKAILCTRVSEVFCNQ